MRAMEYIKLPETAKRRMIKRAARGANVDQRRVFERARKVVKNGILLSLTFIFLVGCSNSSKEFENGSKDWNQYENRGVGFEYPEGWHVARHEGYGVGVNQIISVDKNPIDYGGYEGAGGAIQMYFYDGIRKLDLQEGEESSVLQKMIQNYGPTAPEDFRDEIFESKGGITVHKVSGTTWGYGNGPGDPLDSPFRTYFFELANGPVQVIVQTYPGDIDEYLDVADHLVRSLSAKIDLN